MKKLFFAASLLATVALGPSTFAQTAAAPSGTLINPFRNIIGTTPGTVAGGDALAAAIATLTTTTSTANSAIQSTAIGNSVASQTDARFTNLISASSTGTTPVSLATVRSMPAGIALQRLSGHIEGQAANGDTVSFDVAVLVKRTSAGGTPVLLYSAISQFYADTSLTSASVSVAAGTNGVQVNGVGVASTNIAWSGSLN